MSNPKISVIMSVYNGEMYLREAVDSILNQTFADFEFIVVNDGSTDNSLKILQSYDDERIKIINNEMNIGLTKSLNKALKQARGEYVARQDADDISLPNRFEEQIRYFERHPEVSLLGTNVYKIDEDGQILGKVIALAKPTLKDLSKSNRFSHGSVMFKRAVINELGGYNEWLRYVQDYELWLRVAKKYEVRNLTQELYKLRSHRGQVGFTVGEAYALYHILAQRFANGEVDEALLEAIKEEGVMSLCSDLSKSEKIYFHKAKAGLYLHSNNMKLARNEYKKILLLNPFDMMNNVNIVRSYFGKRIISITSQIYERSVNLRQAINNRSGEYRTRKRD